MALLSRRDPNSAADRRDRRAALQAELMSATVELLRDGNSYADLSIETIAARAGVSRTTFYDYFGDKRELLLAFGDALLQGHARGDRRVAPRPRPRRDARRAAADPDELRPAPAPPGRDRDRRGDALRPRGPRRLGRHPGAPHRAHQAAARVGARRTAATRSAPARSRRAPACCSGPGSRRSSRS